jgi:Uma2 family endonuclease
MNTTVAKFTVNEYHRIVQSGVLDDRRVELLNGLIVEMAPEGIPHAYYSDESGSYLERLLGDRVKVREGKPITLPNDSEPEPDIAVVKPLGAVYLQHHPYPEDIYWLIEYSNSSLAKDTTDKVKIYAAAGIPEYWVVDLKDKSLIVFREPVGETYQQMNRLTEGEIAPLAFPDVRISVRRLMS